MKTVSLTAHYINAIPEFVETANFLFSAKNAPAAAWSLPWNHFKKEIYTTIKEIFEGELSEGQTYTNKELLTFAVSYLQNPDNIVVAESRVFRAPESVDLSDTRKVTWNEAKELFASGELAQIVTDTKYPGAISVFREMTKGKIKSLKSTFENAAGEPLAKVRKPKE